MFDSRNIRAEMARNSKGMKQMAEELGMSSNSFRYKLTGKREFTLRELEIMATLFNCSLDYLSGRSTA